MHQSNNQQSRFLNANGYGKLAAALGIAAAVGAMLAAGIANARHHAGGAFAGGHFPIVIADVEKDVGKKMQARFDAADEDASGDISLQEFLRMDLSMDNGKRRFRRGHGFRHARRHGAPVNRAGQRAEQAEKKEAVQDRLFSLLDSNADGNVSDAEFKAADHRQLRKQAREEVLFKRLDADGNGVLTLAEMPNPVAHLQTADTNNDGEVSKSEMRTARKARGGKQNPIRMQKEDG